MRELTWAICRWRWAVASIAALTLLGAVSCGDDGDSEEGDRADESSGEVVLVTYDAFALPEEAARTFEERFGRRIEVVAAGDSGALLAGALLSAGAPQGDVLFGVDNTTATQVLEEPLLSPVAPAALERVDPTTRLPGELGELLVPIDTGDVCVNADVGWFADHGLELPTSFESLTDPRYRDLLVVESPVSSSPGLAFLLGTVSSSGADAWPEYWQDLRAVGVRVAPSWDDAYYNDYTVNGGDRPLVVSYASSPPAEVVFSEGARTEPASTVLQGTCVAQVEYAGVLDGAPHPEAAAELVEFMLSDEWQSALPLSNFVYPVTDVVLPEEFTRWAPRPPSSVQVDAIEVGARRDEWIEQWRAVME
jgi:thiamine transport system substrate-binding protein